MPISDHKKDEILSWPRLAYLVPLVSAVLGATWLSLFSNTAWIHPELTWVGPVLWNGVSELTAGELTRAFQWLPTFSPIPFRPRYLNDLFEIIDAATRPVLVPVFGVNLFLLPSVILSGILSPIFFYLFLRHRGLSLQVGLILCAIFISSTGFLSAELAYIRPAKKLNILFLCLSLYLAQRAANGNLRFGYWPALLSTLVSFFSDELALGNFVFILLFYFSNIWKTSKYQTCALLSLPFVYVLIIAFASPTLYGLNDGVSALHDSRKLGLLRYIVDPEFYRVAYTQTASSIVTSLGVWRLNTALEAGAFFLLLLGMIFGAWRWKTPEMRASANSLGLASLMVLLYSGYATLLDWYPFPYKTSEMGRYNFYYHSSIVVLVLFWVGTWSGFLQSRFEINRMRKVVLAVPAAALLIVMGNLYTYSLVNYVMQGIHLYPYSNEAIYRGLVDAKSSLDKPETDRTVTIETSREEIEGQVFQALKSLYGDNKLFRSDLYLQYSFFSHYPLTTTSVLHNVIDSHFPNQGIKTIVRDDVGASQTKKQAVPLTGFKATREGPESILLKWEPVESASYYLVEMSEDLKGFRPLTVLSANRTALSVGKGGASEVYRRLNILDDSFYSFRLMACKNDYCTAWASAAVPTWAVSVNRIPEVPVIHLKMIGRNPPAVRLSWPIGRYAEYFVVEAKNGLQDFAAISKTRIIQNEVTVSPLPHNLPTHFRLKACSRDGCSEWSKTISTKGIP